MLAAGTLWAVIGCKVTSPLEGSSGVPLLTGQDPLTVTSTGAANSGSYSVDFGNVAVGLDEPAVLVLTNSGTSPLRIVNVGAPSDAEFSVTLPAGIQIPSGGSSSVPVDFKPFSKGAKSATVAIQTDSSTIPVLTLQMEGTGVDLRLDVGPQLLDFGNVVVHTSMQRTITLANISDLDLTITPGAVTGGSGQLFTLSQAAQFVLQANSTSSIRVTYSPLAPSQGTEDRAAFTLSPSVGALITVSLQGNAVQSGLQISPDPLDFNFVQPGQQLTLPLTLHNLANQDLTISSIAVNDPGAGQVFALTAGAPMTAGLPAGQSLAIDVIFSPIVSQHYSGTLRVDSDDSLGSQTIPLQGYGGGAAISCAPLKLDFGTAPVGFATMLPVICTNTGSDILVSGKLDAAAELRITGFDFSGGNGAFSAAIDPQSPQGALLAGQSALVDVTYTPTSAQSNNASLIIASNVTTPPAPPILGLSGQAVQEQKCYYSVTPPSLSWGQVQPLKDGDTPYTEAFILSNLGPNECLVNGVNIRPGSDTAFSVKPIVSQRLSPPGGGGQFATQFVVPVSFAPAQSGDYTGAVGFTISDPDGPEVRIPLSGTGGESCFLVRPTNIRFGVVGLSDGQYCSRDTKQFVGVNGCEAPVVIEAVTLTTGTSSPPFGLLTSMVPVTVPAGSSSAPFTVGFRPTAPGAYYGSAGVQTDLETGPFGIFFSGSAIAGSTQTDVFNGRIPSADILFTMDTDDDSKERVAVAAFAANFIAALESDGIDFQIGVTSTDLCLGKPFEQARLLPCDGCHIEGASQIITASDPSAATDLQTLLEIMGTKDYDCLPDEQFFETAYQALISGTAATANNALGFVRPGAYLAVITANQDNEDDNSSQTVGYYESQLLSTKGYDHPELFSWSYINPSQFGSSGGHQPFNRLPTRIAEMLSQVGGVALDTSQPEWWKGILDLWQIALASTTQFALTGTPDPSTIEVYLDGPPPDQADGGQLPGAQIQPGNNGSWNWRYDAPTNTLQVNPDTLSLGASDVLYVTYTLVCSG
jgi:hypothetical protein